MVLLVKLAFNALAVAFWQTKFELVVNVTCEVKYVFKKLGLKSELVLILLVEDVKFDSKPGIINK